MIVNCDICGEEISVEKTERAYLEGPTEVFYCQMCKDKARLTVEVINRAIDIIDQNTDWSEKEWDENAN